MNKNSQSLEDHFFHVKKLISEYEIKYGREKDSVLLLAASKKKTAEQIGTLYRLGQKQFGENYLQEALTKMKQLSALLPHHDIEWHFIGPIQSNKTKKIAEHFSWVQGIDEHKIAKRLNDQRPLDLPPLNVCIEVNVSHEDTKSGVKINEVLPLTEYCLSLPRLKLQGLMAIPKPQSNFADQRKEFHKLFLLQESLAKQNIHLNVLSMGMSDDFEAAIAEGSTMVRIGTLIFGAR